MNQIINKKEILEALSIALSPKAPIIPNEDCKQVRVDLKQVSEFFTEHPSMSCFFTFLENISIFDIDKDDVFELQDFDKEYLFYYRVYHARA